MLSLGNADDAASLLLLGPANLREPLTGHVGIVRALVVVRINEDVNIVVPLREQGQRSRATERIVVRMRREQQDRLAL